MNREKLCLVITGAVCLFGCAFLCIFNLLEAYYSYAEIIPKREYYQSVAIVSQDGESAGVSDSETININTASAEQLAQFLPGIGEKKANNIVVYRKNAGGFHSVDELINVDGIGKKTLENIRPYCRVND